MILLLLLAVALAMDAFAVSIACGATRRPSLPDALRIALVLGGAQALMPLAGYALGKVFAGAIDRIDHWVAFVLLGGIGLKMIHEGLAAEAPEAIGAEAVPRGRMSNRTLLLSALATSIDAAAAGITLPTLGLPIGLSVVVIGVVTVTLSFAGIEFGARIGARIGKAAEVGGGIVLIMLGARILLQHTGWLG